VLYTAVVPAGTRLILEIQTGNTPTPDTSWSRWVTVTSGDTLADSLASRYIHYRATLRTNFLQAPRLEEVRITYPGDEDAAPDSIISPPPDEVSDCRNRLFLFQVRNLGNDTVDIPVHCMLDSLGVTVYDSLLTVTDVGPGETALAMFGGVYCCPGESLWVITELANDVVPENDTLVALLGVGDVAESPQTSGLRLDMSSGAVFNIGLSNDADISLVLYDASGRLVRVLDEGRRNAGAYRIAWDGLDEHGAPAGAGVYFVRLETPTQTLTRKFILVE